MIQGKTVNINLLHKKIEAGNRSAEEELFRHLSERFLLFLQHKVRNRQDAEEILQDTLMTISAKYKTIEFATSFSAWAHKVLSNNILMYYRTKGRRDEKLVLLDNSGDLQTSWNPGPDLEPALLDCLKKLNKANRRHARILNFHYQGYSIEEIQKRLRLSRNNFYVVLHRARTMLKSCLDDKGATP